VDVIDIDLLDRDAFVGAVPHEWFTHLRREAPVWFHPERDGAGFWVFSKHDDVVAMNRMWEAASSEQSRGGVVQIETPTPEEQAAIEAAQGVGRMMLMMDPPDHTRYRKLVNRGFTPRMVRALEEHMKEVTDGILDGVFAKGGTCDFVVDVAAELPLELIAEFLGVPSEDRHKIFDWSNRMIGSEDPEYIVAPEEIMNAQIEMFMYAQELAADRRSNPRQDIISALIHGEVDGDKLSETDFNLFFLLLAVAGNETTRNAMSHGMHALLAHPDQYQAMVDDPSLVDSAVEEILRWASPVMYFRRNITHDLEYKGQQLREGDKITLWYISANRDEDVFDDPFRFDILRDPNPHIAFGGGGPHHCLGANLARMEMQVLFNALVRRAPRVDQLGEPERLRSNFINGLKHLPVQLHEGVG
jgi:cholest-4-en-3-one 26-monooxygenase